MHRRAVKAECARSLEERSHSPRQVEREEEEEAGTVSFWAREGAEVGAREEIQHRDVSETKRNDYVFLYFPSLPLCS